MESTADLAGTAAAEHTQSYCVVCFVVRERFRIVPDGLASPGAEAALLAIPYIFHVIHAREHAALAGHKFALEPVLLGQLWVNVLHIFVKPIERCLDLLEPLFCGIDVLFGLTALTSSAEPLHEHCVDDGVGDPGREDDPPIAQYLPNRPPALRIEGAPGDADAGSRDKHS